MAPDDGRIGSGNLEAVNWIAACGRDINILIQGSIINLENWQKDNR